jgi:hypothetical protein
MKRTRLRKIGKSPVSKVKREIQAILRRIVIERDGGCVLRHHPKAGKCGGMSSTGNIILQAEHLNGRSHAVSFGELDNIVCLCTYHHLYFKKREPVLYWTLIRVHIGEERWLKVEGWAKDRSPHKIDFHRLLEELKKVVV